MLEDYVEHLREKIERDLLSEATEEAEAFRSGTLTDPKDSEEAVDRLFAVRRLLESSRLDLGRQVFSCDELLRLLPKLKFSEQDEEQLRLYLEQGG